ncbi:Uncharacterised protein [Escherichia coli]|jgi:hypothetical protein|nr:hypothetical protein P837_05325 [Klebsiella pneumoniae UCI 34]VVY47499.1 Uncharacterised protein [Escherichia coli]VWN04155.1 Uncharacterised protein [Escherichia coli]
MDSPLKVLYMNRRLRLAAEPQTGRREVSALTDARKTLAYDFFRILRAPHKARCDSADGEAREVRYS